MTQQCEPVSGTTCQIYKGQSICYLWRVGNYSWIFSTLKARIVFTVEQGSHIYFLLLVIMGNTKCTELSSLLDMARVTFSHLRTQKECLADLLTRWIWFLYPEIICYMLQIDNTNTFAMNYVTYEYIVKCNVHSDWL